jgi:heme a synthase
MLFSRKSQYSLLFRLSLMAVILALCVVVLGAFTRLVHAGLGCPDWPGCYGHLWWPNSSEEITQANTVFPDSPVDIDKTWPEMVHRYFAGGLGLLILTMTLVCLYRARNLLPGEQRPPVKHAIGLLLLVTLQAVFGMWTVTLQLWPQVVTAHLLGGFATLSLLWLFNQRIGGHHWYLLAEQVNRLKPLKSRLYIALGVVIVQISLGGWTSANYAALSCPDLPMCLASWWPAMDFVSGFNIFQHVGPNYLGGLLDSPSRTAIHMSHRLGAVTVVLVLIYVGISMWRTAISIVRSWVVVLWGCAGLQVALGLSNILFSLPLPIAVAHNAVGAILLLTVVTLLHRVTTASDDQ